MIMMLCIVLEETKKHCFRGERGAVAPSFESSHDVCVDTMVPYIIHMMI
jgi:hypothetical protein